jgi:drug/metabolite transporter (DMT)-like permease
MKDRGLFSSFLLLLAAVVWGFAFVAQRSGMEHTGPLLFNGIRFLMGGLLLIPVYLFFFRKKDHTSSHVVSPHFIWPGLILFAASFLQQKGLVYTTAGNAGFITAVYMVLVPVIGILIGQRIPRIIWVAVPISLAGTFLVSYNNSVVISEGDAWVFASAFFWAGHVLVISWLVQKYNAVLLALSQFLICGIISIFLAVLSEPVIWTDIQSAAIPLLYGGIMSVGLAFTLQVIGQRHAHPSIASVLLSSESLFAVIGGWLILNESMTVVQAAGCALIFSAIIIIQLFRNRKTEKQYV